MPDAPDLLWDDPEHPLPSGAVLVLAHGAGAPMDAADMTRTARALADAGLRVARFEFGYMAARRGGTRKPPPRAETLVGEYRAAVAAVGASTGAGTPLLIGGRSMGGRVATLVLDELWREGVAAGGAVISYPWHPPGKPEQPRIAHLEHLSAPLLVCQGTRDPFGSPEDVAGYPLSASVRVEWFDDGDHSLVPRKTVSGHTAAEHLARAAALIAAFATSLGAEPGGG
ncbi:MAG: hypothetical protein J0G30_06225 [Actinomycetales bacterium]|nr:hypothetical protein [Actinomycetales bacterium]